MSRKNSSVTISSEDEKLIMTKLRQHILENVDKPQQSRLGVIKPSDPTAFPLVDAATVAHHWKETYPIRASFQRYSKNDLTTAIQQCHTKILSQFKASTSTALSTSTSAIISPTTLSTAPSNNTASLTKKSILVKDTKPIIKRQKSGFIDSNAQKSVQLGFSTSNATNVLVGSNNSVVFGSPLDEDGIDNVATTPSFQTQNEIIAGNSITIESDDDIQDEEIAIDLEDEYNNDNIENDISMGDDDTNDIVQLDRQTSQLSLTTAPSQSYFGPTTSTPSITTPIANPNSSLNNIYNPNAVPYSQRSALPSTLPTGPKANNKPQSRKQLERAVLKDIYEDAKHNVPIGTKLRQVYKKHRDHGYNHPEAEALARRSLNMQYVEENLPRDGGNRGDNGKKGVKKSNKQEDGKESSVVPVRPTVTLKEVGGIDAIIQDIREIIEYPLTHPEIFSHLGVSPPKGVLLHGPPGCGKTLLANAIAGELNIPMIKLQATEIVSKLSGESEGKIRQIFQDAAQYAPCIIFIDDIDVIAGKKDTDDGNDMKRRIVTQLMQSIDQLNEITSEMDENGGALTTDLHAEELLARNDMKFNPLTGEMEIAKSVAEKALELNEDNTLMMRTAMMNNNKSNKTIIVLGATSRLETIDPALRRAGRFDREIALGIPDEFARASILRKLTAKMRLNPNCNIDLIGKATVGFVGADLVSLTREAAILSLNRIFNDNDVWSQIKASMAASDHTAFAMSEGDMKDAVIGMIMNDQTTSTSNNVDLLNSMNADKTLPLTKTQEKKLDLEHRNKIAHFLRHCGPLSLDQLTPFDIKQEDFMIASKKVQPTAKREGFATVPETTWADVGALDLLRAELDMAIVQPIQEPELFESLGLNTPAGVLLFGPPGCGKTLVAKAVANASGASFLSVKGPELLNQYVGESERAVRQVFKRAQMCSPCVIFFDELDALVPKRSGGSGNHASERVVNQLLTELDGFDDRRGVFVIAATNRPDIIDPAVLRPGRLDKLLYLPLPDAEGRLSILMKHTRRTPFDLTPFQGETDEEKRYQMLHPIAFNSNTEGFSGADMQALVREATTAALKQYQVNRAQLLTQGKTPPIGTKVLVTTEHFHIAFTKVRASVSAQSRKEYEQLCQRITQGKGILQKDVHSVADGSQTDGASR